jgi:hypothetical protein
MGDGPWTEVNGAAMVGSDTVGVALSPKVDGAVAGGLGTVAGGSSELQATTVRNKTDPMTAVSGP